MAAVGAMPITTTVIISDLCGIVGAGLGWVVHRLLNAPGPWWAWSVVFYVAVTAGVLVLLVLRARAFVALPPG